LTPVLFLVDRMMRGWGVGVVVHNVALRLVALGHRVTVGCLESDDTFV